MISTEQLETARAKIEEAAAAAGVRKNMKPGTISLSKPGRAWTRIVWHSNHGGGGSAYGFICMKDNGPFKEGDLLAAATWDAPAKNQARGNILTGDFSKCEWCSMAYLR